MANEIQVSIGTSGLTIYALIRNSTGLIWRTDTNVFESFLSANLSHYTIALTEQSTSGYYTGNFPTQITAGVYSITAKNQLSGGAAITDPPVAAGDLQWQGTYVEPLSDLATSGQVASFAPLRIARSQQLLNFTFPLVSSTDHITSFTSGVVSGQISKDGASFVALQSGAFIEIGLGFYSTSLTSGDLTCNTAGLLFTATGISGGTSDPRRFSIVTQRISGF